LLRSYWQKQHAGADFEMFWRKSLHDGWIEGSAYRPKQVALKAADFPVASQVDARAIEINFRRDPSIWDGRFANNGWLQELPKPLTKMTWDNPLLIGVAMAERLGLEKEDVVELELQGKKLMAPVWVQAGHPDNSVTVFLGYGRSRAGRTGTGFGINVYHLRTSAIPWFTTGASLRKTGDTYKLATTQGYQTMETPIRRCGQLRSRTTRRIRILPVKTSPSRTSVSIPGCRALNTRKISMHGAWRLT